MINDWRIKKTPIFYAFGLKTGTPQADDSFTVHVSRWSSPSFRRNKAQTSPFLAEDTLWSVSWRMHVRWVFKLSLCVYYSAQRKCTQSLYLFETGLKRKKGKKTFPGVQKVTEFSGGGISCCYVTRFIFVGGHEQVITNYIIEFIPQQPFNPRSHSLTVRFTFPVWLEMDF